MKIREGDGLALRYLVIEPDDFQSNRPYPLVFLLHGFGSNMRDLAGLCSLLNTEGYVFALPNAPVPVEIGYGSIGYAWHQLVGTDVISQAVRSEELLADFFQGVLEEYSVEFGQAVLGGFSQGGMMTYSCGLRRPKLFVGLAALSARIPEPDVIKTKLPVSRTQRIFISHGSVDPVIPIQEGRESRRFLESEGYSPKYCEYDMGHEINQDVASDFTLWIQDVLPPALSSEHP